MKKKIWLAAASLALAVFLAVSYAAGWLLTPPRQSYGSTWASYLKEEEDTIDVLCFGSSLVYCNIVPGVVWAESGVTAYLMAGPEQTIPLSYYYIKEACRTQSPKVVALEVTGMFYPQYCDYTKVNVSYMPWSANRLAATFSPAAERERRAGLLFPLLDYHSRWSEATPGDVAARLFPQRDPMAGYTFLAAATPQGEAADRDYSADTENYRRNLDYLGRIHDFCQSEGIQLLLFLTPTKGAIPDEALERLKEDVATLPHARFADFNEDMEELGIEDWADWFDFLHFNWRGAEKFSRHFAAYLTGEFSLSPTGAADESLWNSRADEFAALSAGS